MTVDRWVGQVLGARYQVEALLGQGGMSAVYRAQDLKLQREVAIKLIHSHLSDEEEFVRRFETEATAIARLRHPNIVQVYDLVHEDNLYYMVLEYLSGETLQKCIKRMNEACSYIPLRDVLQYAVEICKASDYAHHRGMVHRDIKPANVMLDQNGNAVLMDFGIARIVEGKQQHTATGAVLGTALYMSPEQIQGLHPDARSDIYSIGVTLFEMLGGRPPFESDSIMSLMMMHLNDPPPDLSQLHPGIPEVVRAIVNRALAKKAEDRFQTCGEMVAALQRAQDLLCSENAAGSTVIEAAPIPAPERTFVEPVQAAPSRAASGATYVEPSPSRPPKPVQAFESAPPVPPASRKKTFIWIAAAAVLLLVVVGGGIFAYNQLLPQINPPPQVTATSDLAAIAAAIQSTQAAQNNNEPEEPPAELAAVEPSPLPSSTATELPAPTETVEILPTATVEILPTDTPAPPAAPVIGGADKIAYLFEHNIWTVNVDGSDMQQITTDGSVKTYLRWLPDGQGLSYISGKCIQTAGLDGSTSTVTCFNNATYLDSFEVSPDGTQVALALDRQLYLLPFNLERLAQVDSHPDLVGMADCAELAPYQRNAATSARWSKDGKLLAAVTLGVLANNVRGDVVQVFAVDRCIANPLVQVQFPPPHFNFGEYSRNPTLAGLTWDGASLFAMNGITRNAGFGNLHFFNRETFLFTQNANPIKGNCCYRSPQFSPDGNYLVFAFQDMTLGPDSRTELYYVPYGTIGTETNYQPLPLQEYSDPKEDPQPVLRPAAAP